MACYDNFTAKVGDVILVAREGQEPLEMQVWHISPPGAAGRSYTAGPVVHAHVRPGGYGFSFDNASIIRLRITRKEGA